MTTIVGILVLQLIDENWQLVEGSCDKLGLKEIGGLFEGGYDWEKIKRFDDDWPRCMKKTYYTDSMTREQGK